MSFFKKENEVITPTTVDDALVSLQLALDNLDYVRTHHEAEAANQTVIVATAKARAEKSIEEAARANRIHGNISALLK